MRISRGLRLLLLTKMTRFRLSSFLIYVWREFEYICFHTSCPFNLLLFSQINAHHLHGNCHYGGGSCANVRFFCTSFTITVKISYMLQVKWSPKSCPFFTFFPHISHFKSWYFVCFCLVWFFTFLLQLGIICKTCI